MRTTGTPDRDERTALHAPAQPRIVTLHLRIRGDDLAAFERNRATLAAAFAPWRDSGLRARPGILTATLADGRVRALRALPRQGLSWGAGRQRGAQALESISLEAPDPFWYDPAGASRPAAHRAGRGAALQRRRGAGLPGRLRQRPAERAGAGAQPGQRAQLPRPAAGGPQRQSRASASARRGANWRSQLTVPPGVSLRVRCGAQPDGSADAPAAHLIDDLGGESNVLGSLRSGSRFWALGPGENTIAVAQESPAGATTVEYAYFPRHVAI